MKLMKLVLVGVLVATMSVLAMDWAAQTAHSQCCPGPPPSRGSGGTGGGGGAAQPAPPLNWEAGDIADLADEDARRPDMVIKQMEEAKEGSKPVILYVSTESDDRRYARAREACELLQCCLFGNHRVATAMNEGFVLVRVNLEDLDRHVLRKYNIRAGVAPQVLIYDVDLGRVDAYQGASIRVSDFERALERAQQRTEAILERREREASR